ncbi:nucleotidyltransferase family protein [Roseofilum sp. Guam]|uniref:nucleotidyltransferase family protein n=1 Tax=Roseofilum sp. Guam TaxID=2821502 RepID=UPI001B0ED408|nr:nucleotidyltransferase family protein [Roseofilum sp. Guam]MBP0029247.1 nucleotidyltransferase family protein [Roseofilum sp. Guam]
MNLQQLEQYRSKIIKLSEQYHSTNIRVFGSVAKGENTENSDIDFLIDPKPEQDLFDVIRLRRALQELLNCDVDIVHSTALHHSIRQEILSSAIPL